MLERVQSVVKDIQRRETVSLNDALKIFGDLCEDIKTDTGNTIENQPVTNAEEMVQNLCSAARIISRIYARNMDVFDQPGYRTRWEKAEKRLEETNRRMEELEVETARYRLLLEEVYQAEEQLNSKREEIAKAQESLRDLKKQKQNLTCKMEESRNSIEQYREQINQIRDSELPQLQDCLEAAEKEYGELVSQRQRTEEQIAAVKNDGIEMQSQIEDAEEVLRSEDSALLEREKLLKEYSGQCRQLAEAKQLNRVQLDAVKNEIADYERGNTQLQQELERYKRDVIPALMEQKQRLQENQEMQKRQERELEEKIAGLESDAKKLMDDYTVKKTALEQKHGIHLADEEKIAQMLQRQEQQQKEELERKRRENGRLQESINAQNAEIQQVLQQIREATDRELEITQETGRLTCELENKKREYLRMESDNRRLSEELARLQKQYEVPLAQILRRKRTLDQLCSRLSEDEVFQKDWNSAETMQEAAALKKAVETGRQQAQQKVEEFREAYVMLTKFLEEGGY